MGRKKRGRSAKGARASQQADQETGLKQAPHSFVFNRGHVGKNVRKLISDMRRVMEPFTAANLQPKKSNVLKDFVNIAGVLNVTHFLIFTKTETSTNMKIARLPRGPTLSFKVNSYSLSHDVLSSQKKPNIEQKPFFHHPLLVMNNFSGDGMHLKLLATMFQNMFPSINVNKVKLDDIKRCVLVNYNPDTKLVDIRHYTIKVVPVGMSRGVKKLIKSKLPDLGKYEDISDYIVKGGNLSESEAEMDGPDTEVTLPQRMAGRGNVKSGQSAIRLKEIGPRLTLQLIKIEEGICDGKVLFHEFVQKTPQEVKALEEMRTKKKKVKQARKAKQDENIRKKMQVKEQHKEKSLEGMKKAGQLKLEKEGSDSSESEDDDQEYFRQEVGSNPDPELFSSSGAGRKRKKSTSSNIPNKRFKKKTAKPRVDQYRNEDQKNKKKRPSIKEREPKRRMFKKGSKRTKGRGPVIRKKLSGFKSKRKR